MTGHSYSSGNLAKSIFPSSHLLHLPWNPSTTVLALASNAGIHEYTRWRLNLHTHPLVSGSREKIEPRDLRRTLQLSAVCGLAAFYSRFWGEFPPAYTLTLQSLIVEGAPLNLAWDTRREGECHMNAQDMFHLPTHRGASGPIWRSIIYINRMLCEMGVTKFCRHANLSSSFTKSLPLVDTPPVSWIWLVILPSILNSLIRVTCPQEVWDFLETWLTQAKAPPPERIRCRCDPNIHHSMNGIKKIPGNSPSVTYQITVANALSPLPDDISIARSTGSNSKRAGKRVINDWFYVDGGRRERFASLSTLGPRNGGSDGRVDRPGRPIPPCFGEQLDDFGWTKEVSLADLVRCHAPENMGVLLAHLEQHSRA